MESWKQRWLIDRWRVEGDPYNPTVWPQVTERLKLDVPFGRRDRTCPS